MTTNKVNKIVNLIDQVVSKKSTNIGDDIKTLSDLVIEMAQDEKDTLSIMLANDDDLYQKYKYFLSLFPDKDK